MKKISTMLLVCSSILCHAQEASVERSVSGIQAGFFGLWIHNESRISGTVSFRSEAGFDTEIWGGSFYGKPGFSITPVLTAEPRVYYNLNERVVQSKDISNNSGNFVSLKTSFHPGWVVISNSRDVAVVSNVSLLPTWGIRRNIGMHVNYEAGLGIGYMIYFDRHSVYTGNNGEVAVNLHLRIGYVF